MSVISDSAAIIANVLQSACIIASVGLYVLVLSSPAFAPRTTKQLRWATIGVNKRFTVRTG